MKKAILFDLDGTLLPLDTEKFLNAYFKKISQHFSDRFHPKAFTGAILEATRKMMKDETKATNESVFKTNFLKILGQKEEQIWPQIEGFYEKEFPSLASGVKPHPEVPHLIRAAKEKGYILVVATNAVFPMSAIIERIRWAGLDPCHFNLITGMENMSFCKPSPRYYEEISEKIGVPPEQCLMVGNDMQQDMSARNIGMKTYLVTDHLIDRGNPVYEVNGKGSLHDFYTLLVQDKLESLR